MTVATVGAIQDTELRVFDPRCAGLVVSWVRTPEELFHLAPKTAPPLTTAKVLGWCWPQGYPLLLWPTGGELPIGYAELNPMRSDSRHFWLGHVVLDPRRRGQGQGRRFVQALLRWSAAELGARRLSLVVFPDNQAAVACYLKAGFSLHGEEYHRFAPDGPKHRLLRFETHLHTQL